jgi:transcriptional regulator GlxA family with amidase domain
MAKTPVRRQEPEQIGFFIVPKFQLFGFAAAIETLRVANFVSGRRLYSWVVVAEDGSPVRASNGIAVTPDAGIAAVETIAAMLVCGSGDNYQYRPRRVLSWLRKLARAKTMLGAIGPGVFLLARAGLLNGYRCTAHWEDFETLAREFPLIKLTSNVFEIDRDRMTCPGFIPPIDMMLNLIQRRHGRRLVTEVADRILQHELRGSADTQRTKASQRLRIRDKRLLAVVSAMETHLEEPLSLGELARISGLSLRHLQRRFVDQLGLSPGTFYRELRLQQARRLLMRGAKSVLDAALATGFSSGSHFTRRYRTQFGHTPRDDRSS